MSFRKYLPNIGRPTPKPVYIIHNLSRLKLLTRLRLGINQLNQHKFNYNFRDCVNPLCPYSLEVESSSNFFLHCYYRIDTQETLSHELMEKNISNQSDNEIVELLLYGSNKFNIQQNCSLSKSAIKLILK